MFSGRVTQTRTPTTSAASRFTVTYDPAAKGLYTKFPISVQKTLPNAEYPYKDNESDIGYDITLQARLNNVQEDSVGEVTMFETGLKIAPPPGYYVEIHARSSLQSKGYMLANGVGIIDPEYRGTLRVALLKFREGEDLELPFRAVQMIPRQAVYMRIAKEATQLSATARGEGGFGSTGFSAPSNRTFNDDAFAPVQTPVSSVMTLDRRTNGLS